MKHFDVSVDDKAVIGISNASQGVHNVLENIVGITRSKVGDVGSGKSVDVDSAGVVERIDGDLVIGDVAKGFLPGVIFGIGVDVPMSGRPRASARFRRDVGGDTNLHKIIS